jgi:hypothetical protein
VPDGALILSLAGGSVGLPGVTEPSASDVDILIAA